MRQLIAMSSCHHSGSIISRIRPGLGISSRESLPRGSVKVPITTRRLQEDTANSLRFNTDLRQGDHERAYAVKFGSGNALHSEQRRRLGTVVTD